MPQDPSQGAPAPDAAAAPADAPDDDGGGSVSAIFQQVADGLSQLQDVASKSSVLDDGEKQQLGQCNQLFQDLMQKLQGGGQAPPSGGAPVPMEAGGAKVSPAY